MDFWTVVLAIFVALILLELMPLFVIAIPMVVAGIVWCIATPIGWLFDKYVAWVARRARPTEESK